MFGTIDPGKVLFVLMCVLFGFWGCNRDREIQELQTARARAERRAQTAKTELESTKAKLESTKAELESTKAELESTKAELQHGIPQSMQKRITELEKLTEKLPRVIINNVQLERKKKGMDIAVKFNIYNRRGIEGSVKVSFYLQGGPALEDKHGRKITISKKFTPKRVKDEGVKVTLSMSYADLNVKQPRDLKFILRVYDEPTQSFLDQEPYSQQFHYNPFK